LQAVINKKHLS